MFSYSLILQRIKHFLTLPVSSAPLGIMRICLGLLLCISSIRFVFLGWIEEQFIKPHFHFHYFGFSWIPYPSIPVMYAVYGMMILASIFVIVGYHYRIAIIVLWWAFTYAELWDAAYYLNHYYAVSVLCGIMIFLPAHARFSIDAFRTSTVGSVFVPRWMILILQFQIAVIYVYAGIAKINSDWLLHALPLSIWLPAHSTLPLIGNMLTMKATAFVFSWFGMIYDCTIPFFLLYARTRIIAFCTVILFHSLTGILFQIGVFPIVMIVMTILFFPSEFHESIGKRLPLWLQSNPLASKEYSISQFSTYIVGFFILFQLLFPFRYLCYPGNPYWTEQGYRFGWRVMLVEKAGNAQFIVQDSQTGHKGYVDNREWLSDYQEKQMSFQPDLMIQYAHFLYDRYKQKGVYDPIITVDSWVTYNGRASKRFIDSSVNLAKIDDGFLHKQWILPFQESHQ